MNVSVTPSLPPPSLSNCADFAADQSGNEHAKALDRGGWCCYPSDLELWILNAAVRYVLVTRDWAFLAEPVKTTWGEIKTGDALWKITHHLFEVPSSAGGVGLGRHGLLKMLTMDCECCPSVYISWGENQAVE